jgi:hypothetical protein
VRRLGWVSAVLVTTAVVSMVATAVASANTISAICTSGGETAPCGSTWYSGSVTVTWQTDNPPQQVSPCGLGLATVYSTDQVTPLSCTATWSDGSSASYGFRLHLEATPPTATATLARPPDSNGWYNHPVGALMSGTSYSGIVSCSTPTYSGPPGSNVTISGSCTDNAGQTATASATLNYDATPPTITGATASRKANSSGDYTSPVSFTFKGTDPISGIASCQTMTYSGPSSGSVTGGCWDNAGNYAAISVPVKYQAPVAVASVARAGSSLQLRWKKAAHATYYNVQIYRGKKKILSMWPSKTSLMLRQSWKYAGHRYRLKPGPYRWYVWPGYGSRSTARYGRRIVSATFKVTKPL